MNEYYIVHYLFIIYNNNTDEYHTQTYYFNWTNI